MLDPVPVTREGDENERTLLAPRRETVSADKVTGVVQPRAEPEKPREDWMKTMVRAEKLRALGLLARLILAVAGLFLVADMVGLVCQTLTLPAPLRWILVPVEVVLFAAVLGVAAYVVFHMLRLPSFAPVRAQEIECPSEVDRAAEIRRRLMPYVRSFRDPGRYVESLGLEDANERALLARLGGDGMDSVTWREEFVRFQELQERKANEIIGHFCKVIFMKTAICPWKAIDRLSVFYNSTLMVYGIARVYNRKLSKAEAFRLVCSWVFNIYVAGELGAVVEQGAGSVADGLMGGFETSASELLGMTVQAFARIGGKSVEGGMNALLANRLGKRAIRTFRALS